ncbi:MAG: ABC transporter substrate-binding protein [Gammaproteobacteria bacterium]|jgi:oligopeptide transport system substrate-binding protein
MRSTRIRLPHIVPVLLLAVALLAGCGERAWNNPYADDVDDAGVYYSSFSERPKHLDPARSYSANEWAFISQIYEPPLQYHFLKRPYELVPLVAAAMPEIHRYDGAGRRLPEDAPPEAIAYTDYVIRIREGVRYQPHPAFAREPDASYSYWPLEASALASVRTLSDFPRRSTRELTAADFVYQIKRLAYRANHSPVAGLMAEHIRGFAAFSELVGNAQQERIEAGGAADGWLDLRAFEMTGVVQLDRYRYRIRIDGSYPQFVYWLAMNFFAPMPWEAERFYAQPGMRERNITLHWYPVGTGPYLLAENNPNLRMVLEANPNFRGEPYPGEGAPGDRSAGLLDDAGKRMPFVRRAVYSLEKEAIPRWNKFLQGYYDSSGIASDSFDQAVQFGSGGEPELTAAMRDRDIRLNTAVETSIFYTGFNMLDPVVGGDSERARLLRLAISIAIDMEEYVAIFQNGRGEPAQGPLPPGIFGYRAGVEGVNPYVYRREDGRVRRRGLVEAKALLEQAGYPGGRDPATGAPLVLYYDSAAAGPESKALMDWYRRQFEKLGIELVIRATDYNRFQEKMFKGNAQIYSWGWNADYPDPENFFFLLYGPNGKAEHKGENASNYANPEFDALFDEMKNLANGPRRLEVISRMLEILRRDAPWVWGFYPKAFGLQHAWYHNTKPHLMANNTLKYRRIDAGLRARKRRAWNEPVTWPLYLLGAVLAGSLVPALVGVRRRERRAAR